MNTKREHAGRERASYIAKHLVIAVLIYFSYDILGLVFHGILIHGALGVGQSWTESHSEMIEALFVLFALPIYLLAAFWLIRGKAEGCPGEPFFKIDIRKLAVCILLAFSVNGLSFLWFKFVDRFFIDMPAFAKSISSFEDAFSTSGNEAYIWTFLNVVLVGPIVEELVFRALMVNWLKKFMPWVAAAIVSGILFGIWHEELVQSIYTAVMGIILGLVYCKTKSMIYPVAIHVVNNFINGLPPALETDALVESLDMISVICILPGLILLYLVFFKHRPKCSLDCNSERSLDCSSERSLECSPECSAERKHTPGFEPSSGVQESIKHESQDALL
ncbi:MAG: lysostaphin resistance A-like protein [Sphaerochaetaceae bacterium]